MTFGRAILAISITLAMSGCAGDESRQQSVLSGAGAESDSVDSVEADGVGIVLPAPETESPVDEREPDLSAAADSAPVSAERSSGDGKAQAEDSPAGGDGKPAQVAETQARPSPQKSSPETATQPVMTDTGKAGQGRTESPGDVVPGASKPGTDTAEVGKKGRDSAGDGGNPAVAGKSQPIGTAAEIAEPGKDKGQAMEDRAPLTKPTGGSLVVAEKDHSRQSVPEAGDGGAAADKSAKGSTPPIAANVTPEKPTAPASSPSERTDPSAGTIASDRGMGAGKGDPGADDLNRLAALPPDSPAAETAPAEEEPKRKNRPEDRFLKCDVAQLLGRSIGRWRLQGEAFKSATDKAADEVAREIGTVADDRFRFKARVYTNLIYGLKPEHRPEGFAAYAHAACQILTARKGLIPADESSQDMLDKALGRCESGSRDEDDLKACISERMEEIVRERGRRTG
jgi:hypothetical protein